MPAPIVKTNKKTYHESQPLEFKEFTDNSFHRSTLLTSHNFHNASLNSVTSLIVDCLKNIHFNTGLISAQLLGKRTESCGFLGR